MHSMLETMLGFGKQYTHINGKKEREEGKLLFLLLLKILQSENTKTKRKH